uniref:Uncharacterized protein n=1 Tax=Arundo donax TaxID=35708 RepID=A0A0A9FB32_ARUDO
MVFIHINFDFSFDVTLQFLQMLQCLLLVMEIDL